MNSGKKKVAQFEIDLTDKLAKDVCGDVFKAFDRNTGQYCAAKVVNK